MLNTRVDELENLIIINKKSNVLNKLLYINKIIRKFYKKLKFIKQITIY